MLRSGALEADQQLPYNLSKLTFRWAEEDPRVRAAFAAWSRCMAEAGHTYKDPWEPNDIPTWEDPAQENKTAVADVRCKHRTNLAGIWMVVEAAYQHAVVEENRTALNAVEELLHTQLAHARAAVTP
ncbi:hypothetical protein [Streptomyces sp. NPDC000410]|uniref:hypothetical protein n=1 Tax=Streptomyces sp. NPDC000410 TaxID=3154254 RepID=UPI0033238711